MDVSVGKINVVVALLMPLLPLPIVFEFMYFQE